MSKKEKKNVKTQESTATEANKEAQISQVNVRKSNGTSQFKSNLRAGTVMLISMILMLAMCFIAYKVFFGSSELYNSANNINVDGLNNLSVPDSKILNESPGL